jgi:tetratricopeptide (TPR) repeat protein
MPDFAVDDRNAAVVAELCRRLDGLPLAIELVAARVKLLPPAELLLRLHGPWLLSADGLRDVSARQRTLRGTIGWSYDLLSPSEQALFTWLSVFVGGFTLEAAELLCGDTLASLSPSPTHVLDGIASLLDKSLLHREASLSEQPRYEMLETVREFASEQLAYRSDQRQARRRHLDGCLAVTRSTAMAPFVIFNQAGWLELDAEIHNVRAGLNWALEHDPNSAVELVLATSRYLANRGLVDEAIVWTKRALDVARACATSESYAELLFCLGTAEFLAVYHEHAKRSMIELLELSQELGLALGKAGALYYLGRIAAYSGNSFQAEAYLEGSLKVYQEVGAAANADYANILSVLAEMVMFRGDLVRSRTLHMQALAGSLPEEQRRDVIWSLGGLADVAFLEGDLSTARQLAEEFLVICRQRRNPAEVAWAMTCLGEIAIRAGDFVSAHTYLKEALLSKPISDSAWRVPIVEAALGDLALAKGQHELALRLYRASLPILAQRGIFAHPQGSLRLACLASALDQHEVAATLLAACSAAVKRGVEVLFPITQADFERALAASQTALDADTFDGAWATGRSLSPQAAVA